MEDSHRGSYIQLATAETTENGKQFGEARTQKLRIKDPSLVRGSIVLTKRDCIIIAIVFLIVVVAVIVTLAVGLPKLREKRLRYYNVTIPASPSILYNFSQAAVISDGQPCADIGKAIMDKGGSAVDTAIAMMFCNGVVNPQSTGLGGGFLMTIYLRESKTVKVIDAREEAPGNASQNMYEGNQSLSTKGSLAVAVPGELKGLQFAHDNYGKLNWSELVLPSVELCRKGFKVSNHLASKIQEVKQDILDEPTMRELLYNNETSDLYKEGDIMQRLTLANTLEVIAEEGAAALYNGTLTDNFIHDIETAGGIITREDLLNYEAKFREPISAVLRGSKTLYTVPPPGSGAILTMIMNILDGYNLDKDNIADLDSTVLTYHRMIESFKHAFALRAELADEDKVNVTTVMAHLTSRQYADSLRAKISEVMTYDTRAYAAKFHSTDDHGTAQTSVLASNGDAVSITSTINTYFGSMRRSVSTGIILNNEMDDFSSPNMINYFGLPPSPVNYIEPGKRPLSSMCPAFVIDSNGNIELVLGGAGGSRIITATAIVAANVLWFEKNIKQAIDEPRLHHQLDPDYVQNEKSFPLVYLDKLHTFGHEFKLDSHGSIVMAIAKKQHHVLANVDYRKGGSVNGF